MKKILTIATLALSSVGAHANTAATSEPNSQADGAVLLSLGTATEGNATIQVPTIKEADGSICVTYIDTVAPQPSGVAALTPATICVPPRAQRLVLAALRTYAK